MFKKILLILFFSSNCLALDNVPITIVSDEAKFDNASGKATYKGHVIMTQGENKLNSDVLIITKNNKNGIGSLIATGSPAKFVKIEGDEKTTAKAKTIKYFPDENILELVTNAEIVNRDDLIKGENLKYNIKTKSLNSSSSKKRTTVIITPQTSSLKNDR